jgi:hypothetical protein
MMTTRGRLQSKSWFRRRPGGALILAAAVLGAIGCGGSSSSTNAGPAEKFIGRWSIVGTTTTFGLNCPNTFTAPISFPNWTELIFDRGVLTDVTETSPACSAPGLSFNSDTKGTVLSVVNPDPYTSLPPDCSLTIGSDANGIPVFLDLIFTNLTFTQLAAVQGQAPQALLAGTASGKVTRDDGSAATGPPNFVQSDTCTYSGSGDKFQRMTQP